MLEIRALGNLTIKKNGDILKCFGSSKAEAILVYLAMEGGRQSRAGLAALLWPESSNKNALASLRVVLSSLRKYVGDYIEITRDIAAIKKGAEVYLDVHEFEELIARGNLSQALALFTGDLLAGISIQDSNEFEHWRLWEQERLRNLAISALQVAISTEMAYGNYDGGQELASELLKHDPLNEIAHQQYMVALALDGKRTDALKRYMQCRDILMEELELEPSAETERLKDLITQGDIVALAQHAKPKHNLPNPKTSFIGREKEITQIVNLLGDEKCRLLTLIGPGGVGKTRLALNAARRALGLFPDGVFFVPLEGVASPDFLIPAIAESLQFRFDHLVHQSDSGNQLNDFLSNRSVLLIFDGYEHLIEGNALLSEMLQSTANLKLLITSRQKLIIQGEWVHQVTGLPAPDKSGSVEQGRVNSLDLFIERARQANSSLTLTEEELNSALQICQLVEGFPLGIELAAAWTAVLSCAEIAEEIEKSYDFLTSPMQDISERHRSLRATFNYSWQMLSKDQQELLAKLSVFRSGFTRQTAGRIADADLINLTTFLNKSLLQRLTTGRINMHRSICHFTEEKLKESPDIWKEINAKHSSYFIEFLQERECDLDDEKMVAVREEVRQEIENLRAALNWAVLHWDRDAALAAVRAYFSFYLVHGWHEGVIAFERLASFIRTKNEEIPLDDPVYLSCLAHQAWFYSNLGMVEESEKISSGCLIALQERDMAREMSFCLHNLGVNAEFRGEYELSRKLLERAITLGKEAPSVAFPSYYLWLGYVYFLLGEYDEGMRSFKTSYALFTENGNTWAASFALSKMGLAADGLGEHAAAMKYFDEAYQIFLETGDITGQGYSLSRMSIGAYYLEDYQEAVAFGEQAFALFKETGHRWGMCTSLCRLGFAYLGKGEIQKANMNFDSALKQALDSQLVPLSLYALAGIASVLVLEGEFKKGWELFNYVQSHPKTPALYIDVARRWFQNAKKGFSQRKGAEDERAPLAEIVEGVLELRINR
jgi:predicted ATPase/DNA-binding SARP family transcriptional activator